MAEYVWFTVIHIQLIRYNSPQNKKVSQYLFDEILKEESKYQEHDVKSK